MIGKLDEIIYRLDQIRDSQYMLYSAVNEGTRTANQILNAIAQSAQKLESIEQNTEITAFNNSIAANNTKYLKWLEALNL